MESPSLDEENAIKDVRKFFRLEKLKKETIDTTMKDIRNLFRPHVFLISNSIFTINVRIA